jgi:hypothetical protein
MTVHIVNLTNPMMMRGPFRELIPVSARATIKIPEGKKATGVNLLVSGEKTNFETKDEKIIISIPRILDHEIIGIDLI